MLSQAPSFIVLQLSSALNSYDSARKGPCRTLPCPQLAHLCWWCPCRTSRPARGSMAALSARRCAPPSSARNRTGRSTGPASTHPYTYTVEQEDSKALHARTHTYTYTVEQNHRQIHSLCTHTHIHSRTGRSTGSARTHTHIHIHSRTESQTDPQPLHAHTHTHTQ